MARSPIPLRDVLEYLTLEDVEDLVPGSVKYVGVTSAGAAAQHWWSFPLGTGLGWVCLADDSLGVVARVPPEVRARALPLSAHRTKPPRAPPRQAWVGANLPPGARPRWVPTRNVTQFDGSYVAAFLDDFDRVAAAFEAKPTIDRHGGGAGPCRSFFVELTRSRLAMLEWCHAHQQVALFLPDRNGTVFWEDYFQVVDPLGLQLEQVFRQGGITWKHRRPTPAALARTHNHERRMWLPLNRAPARL
ncbi:MAG: hypothetical protein JNG84_00515 [Archangium sp.]|nr:hypothetical protein [Archangium sp.]